MRKQRVNLTGITNREKTVRLGRAAIDQALYTYSDFKLGVLRRTSAGHTANPIESQHHFYRSNNKNTRQRAQISRSPQDLFTSIGGDTDGFVPNAHSRVKLPVSQPLATPRRQSKSLAPKTKDFEHSAADQETQLVHYEPLKTVEGEVSVEKLAQIRRLLRRRYKSQKDFRKIFNSWDRASLGALRAEDIQAMTAKLGVPMSVLEAKTLLASCNSSKSGALSIEEFIQLIFGENESLQLDFAQYETEVNANIQKTQNELKALLKRQVRALRPQFLRVDKNRSGVINFDSFSAVLSDATRKLTTPSEKHIKLLYKAYDGDEGGIEYRQFLHDLETFDENQIISEERPEPAHLHTNSTGNPPEAPKQDPLKFTILDRQQLPPNKVDSLYKEARPIKKLLQQAFPKQELPLQPERTTLSALKQFVLSTLKGRDLHTTHTELESFFSCFIYNKDSETSTRDIVNFIFSDDNKAVNSLYTRARSLPPTYRPTAHSSPARLRTLLKTLEQKTITEGTDNSFKLFKQFDLDGDGYLTYQDIQSFLQKNNIPHVPSDVDSLITLLDISKDNCVSYREFARVMRRGLAETTVHNVSGSQPSKEYLAIVRERLNSVNDKHRELCDSMRPDDFTVQLKPKSRFGATPKDNSGGFLVQAPNTSAYISELDRFVPKRLIPLSLANTDKERLSQARSNRLAYIQRTHKEFKDLLASNQDKQDQLDTQKILKKSEAKEDYLRRVSVEAYI